MDLKDVELMYLPLSRLIARELIDQLSLEGAKDIKERKGEIDSYIHFNLKSLPYVMQNIISVQIIREVNICLNLRVKE